MKLRVKNIIVKIFGSGTDNVIVAVVEVESADRVVFFVESIV